MRDWKAISANCRPMVGDVLHPEDCVVIRIRGGEWRVRPLQLPDGIRYTPKFGDNVEFEQTVDPLGNEPMQKRAAELVEFAATEPEGLDLISAVCGYMAALLDQQYDLANDVKADLLSFRGDTPPVWVEQAMRHAHGLNPQETAIDTIASLLDQPHPQPQPQQKRFWQFWK